MDQPQDPEYYVACSYCKLFKLSRRNFRETLEKIYPHSWQQHQDRMQHLYALQHRFQETSKSPTRRSSGVDSLSRLRRSSSIDGIGSMSFIRQDSKSGWRRPGSDFRALWSCIAFVLTVFHSVEIPAQAGLSYNGYDGKFEWLWYIDISSDSFFILDLFLNGWWFAFINTSGAQPETVLRPGCIWKRYWSSGRFLVDILSIIPWEVLFLFILPESQAIFARLIRLTRCARLSEYFDEIRLMMHHHFGRTVSSSKVTLMALAYSMALIVHWGGCLWYYLGAPRFGYESSRHLQSSMLSKPEFTYCLAISSNETSDTVCTWMSFDGIANDDVPVWIKTESYVHAMPKDKPHSIAQIWHARVVEDWRNVLRFGSVR